MSNERWATLKIPRDLSDEVDRFLETDDAKKRGYYSKSAFISNAIRSALSDFQDKPLYHLNTHEDKIRILDKTKGRIAEIYVKKSGLYCDLCESQDCLHVEFSWGLPDIVLILKKHGLKNPF